KPRISKAGNKYIRQALYMPALVATRHEPAIKGYYRHLIDDNGLKKIQAVCAVMRKLLHAIHGMLNTNQAFDGSRFYAMPSTASN
ncbi:MAG: transposase, partial [Gammaproteobacteria bacterium]